MERNSTSDGGPAMNLQPAVGEINRLKAKMIAIEQEKAAEREEEAELDNIQDSQPLAQALWDAQVPANFKIPQLPTFEGKTDPLEHLMAVGTQTAIIGAEEHLKCKLLSSTLKDAALRWYMNLPKNSIASYTDFHKKFIHQFAGSKHVQYLARFNEATIQVSNPNQEMFVAAVQNGLKAGHFNELLAQKPASTMQEVMKRAECYIKGEESNAEKRSRESREKPSSRRSPERYNRGSSQRSGRYEDKGGGRYRQPWRSNERTYRAREEYTELNDSKVHILDEILSSGLARLPPAPDSNARMGANENAWCHYHRAKGHDTEKCYRLKDLIEKLISSGHLRKFLERAAKGDLNKRPPPRSPRRSPPREGDEKEPKRIAVNTIAGGFAGGGESKAARKRYLRRIIQETNMVAHVSSSRSPEISFSPSDGEGVFPHDNDPLEAFKAMQLAGEQLQPYKGTLVGFGGEQVEVMGHVTLLTTFGEKESAKTIKVRYLVVKTAFTSYNIIIGRPTFNTLGAVLSTLYLSMKYPLDDGRVGTVRGDQAQGRQCYELSLRLKRNHAPADQPIISRVNMISRANMVETSDLDPREEFQDRRVSPIEDLEPIQIGEAPHELTNLGTHLDEEEKEKIIEILRKNVDLFAWKPSDMPGIDETIITHKLAIVPNSKPVSQRKRKVGEERRTSIDEEVHKLKEAGFIEEIKYPEWLANVVLVKKSNGKWRMCVDFTDLNKACPKDPYPLPSIDRLIDGASAFMSNTYNYHYTVMPFGLKIAGATYQRLMDRLFAHQIGKNLEVYIDDMVVKTTSKGEHHEDLKDILASVRKYNMRLNPAKCSFGVQAGRIAALSRFLSCAGEKAFHFFATLKSGERFTWSDKCEEAFQQLKVFLASPPILTRPQLGCPLYLYLAVSENSMSSALVQDVKGEERPVYFVSRIFKGAEIRYQKIEKLSLAVVTTARRLRHYFQNFILELSSPPEATNMQPWTLSVDGASNIRGSGAGVVLEGPDGVLIEQSLRFAFKASNNQAEYEALIAVMRLAKEMEVADLRAKSDSQLVTSQVSGEFQAKDPQLIKYLEQVRSLAKHFNTFELIYVPREQNARADLLSKLASTKKPGNNRTVIQETVAKPSTGDLEVWMVTRNDDWRTPIIQYLENEKLPEEKEEKVKIKKRAAHYTMVGGELYKRGFSSPMLLCVGETESRRILNEIHNGSCGSHIGGRSLAGKVTRAGFFWPTLLSDANRHVRSCDQCQRHADLHHSPGEPLQSVMSPWPFYMWGVDILGPFTTSQGQAKFLLVVVDYFTKWIEAEPVATISSERVKKFYWKNILCRFGIPKYIVSDNGTQFTSESVINFCQEKCIRNTFISVEHPQANGQAESANKVILRAIKRRLEGKDKNWVEHLLPTLWSYHTTIHSSTGETPFKMVYGVDAMIPAEVDPPSWRRATLTAEVNSEALKENLDLLDEVRETAHFREFTMKQRASRKYNTRVMAREFREGDLVLKRPMGRNKGGKLAPNWEGPYRIQEALGGGAYRLETLKGETLPRAWNVVNLRFYYS
ncbi:hypothetical protein TSUD_68800 [Trifolium subterraneum]|uniref:Uncharacterized protein n=1 Tax=Trifolium subterraneum TaxID=3900 RepID=A0A2Z6N6S1_TRISU|nr:hypothetical protein TSUD_68800 [Trifolium subterraneum]